MIKNKLKDKKGITLFTLIMMLILMTLLASITVSITQSHKDVIEDKKKIETKFEQDKSSAMNKADEYKNMYN